METLRQDALQFYDPIWNTAFYDSIAPYVPNYVPSSGRTTWTGQIDLPANATNALAVLAQNGVDFQDNVLDTTAYQYWGDIDSTTGTVTIPSVVAGTYRLTVYATGVFGQYTQDDIVITAGVAASTSATWTAESAGVEIWRIGTPDKSAGEFRHGYALDPTHPLHPEEYRDLWFTYDFPTEFPDGLVYTIGESDEAVDFNYVHWSVFDGDNNPLRNESYTENVNNWTLLWDMEECVFRGKGKATFTIQLAGANTAAGNTDVFNASQIYNNLPYTVVVNGVELEPWIIP